MKKAIGITRKIDPLGRITIPVELRRSLGLQDNNLVEILVADEDIVMAKAEKEPGAGMFRPVDELGRVVIPKELRQMLGMEDRTTLEFFTECQQIILHKYEPGCVFCHCANGELFNFEGKTVCRSCIKQLSRFTGTRRMSAS